MHYYWDKGLQEWVPWMTDERYDRSLPAARAIVAIVFVFGAALGIASWWRHFSFSHELAAYLIWPGGLFLAPLLFWPLLKVIDVLRGRGLLRRHPTAFWVMIAAAVPILFFLAMGALLFGRM